MIFFFPQDLFCSPDINQHTNLTPVHIYKLLGFICLCQVAETFNLAQSKVKTNPIDMRKSKRFFYTQSPRRQEKNIGVNLQHITV